MTFEIVVHGEVILPISLKQAYDEWLSNVRQPKRPIPYIEESIHSEVGNLEPGSVLKMVYSYRKTVTTYHEVTEHTPYRSFASLGNDGLFQLEFLPGENSSTLKTTETYSVPYNLAGLRWVLFSTRMIRSRQFFDVNEWGHHFPGQMKSKYSCKIMGLPHHFVMVPLWLALFLLLSAIYGRVAE